MMTVESMLSKRPVSRTAVALMKNTYILIKNSNINVENKSKKIQQKHCRFSHVSILPCSTHAKIKNIVKPFSWLVYTFN